MAKTTSGPRRCVQGVGRLNSASGACRAIGQGWLSYLLPSGSSPLHDNQNDRQAPTNVGLGWLWKMGCKVLAGRKPWPSSQAARGKLSVCSSLSAMAGVCLAAFHGTSEGCSKLHPMRLQTERKKCIDPSCDGIITFIEAPNKYSILNIEEEVKVRSRPLGLGPGRRRMQWSTVCALAVWAAAGLLPTGDGRWKGKPGILLSERQGRCASSPSRPFATPPSLDRSAVQTEAGGGEAAEEVPEWERFRREQELDKKERRFRFKKSRGRREDEDEVGATWGRRRDERDSGHGGHDRAHGGSRALQGWG